MRVKILTRPTGTIDDVAFDHFRVGSVYELRAQIASVFLAEGWAEISIDDVAAVAVSSSPAALAPVQPLVLVVDDDPDVRRLTESLLTTSGYHVMVAAHGHEAIQRLRDRCPDLIVLDLNMPVMNGWEFRAEQRYRTDEKCAAIPVLLLTSEDDAATHAETLRAVGVVKKPFDPDDLLDAVSAAVGSPESDSDGIGSARPWLRRIRPTT